MSAPYHDLIHNDTLRLRFLLTNHCQQKCPHCLNEYMCKPINQWAAKYIDPDVVKQMATVYSDVMKAKALKRKIYLSGGEPTLHPDFREIVSFIKFIEGTDLTLCTNGNEWQMLLMDGTYDQIDHLHFSFGFLQSTLIFNHFVPIWECLRDWRKTHDKKNIVFSVVTTTDPDFERVLVDMLQYQKDTDYGFTVKLWGDLRFSQDHPINQRYHDLLQAYPEIIHRGPMQHPVNRGIGCKGCERTCPTLKALWVRPDNTCNSCPQATNWHRLLDDDNKPVDDANMEHRVNWAHACHFTYDQPSTLVLQ